MCKSHFELGLYKPGAGEGRRPAPGGQKKPLKEGPSPGRTVQGHGARDPRCCRQWSAWKPPRRPKPAKPKRGAPSQPSAKQDHPGRKHPATRTGDAQRRKTKPRRGNQSKRQTKPDKAEKTRQPRQGRRAEASQGKTRTSDPAQAGQGKQAQGKPKQGKGLGDSRGQSQSALVCHSSIPSETSKTGRAAVVSARPKHNPEAPNTRQSVHVCKSDPVKTCKTGRTAVVSAGARVPAQPRALRIISALPVCRIVLNC